MLVSWITPSSFVDVDLPIINELQKQVKIYWQIVIGSSLTNDMKDYIESHLDKTDNLTLEYVKIPYRVYDLRTFGVYVRILKNAKKVSPDLYYTSMGTAPFGHWIYKLLLPIDKVVAACHNVSTPKGANHEKYNRFFTNLYLRTFKNIQVFSESQRDVLLAKFSSKNVLLAPLALKDYGEPNAPAKKFDEAQIVFLFFGIIMPYKRLDLLIGAAQNLFERGVRNFKVKIAGNCKNWEDYARLIKYPELFDLRIERIPNGDVANLFATSDYFVMPYQDIAQSGAITVAYRYSLPIILSNLPQFQPFAENGKTGFFFQKENMEDLEKKMIQVIEGGKPLYETLKKGLNEFVEEHYSTPAIANKYKAFFYERLRHSEDE